MLKSYYIEMTRYHTNLLDEIHFAANIDAHANNGSHSRIHTCPKEHIAGKVAGNSSILVYNESQT